MQTIILPTSQLLGRHQWGQGIGIPAFSHVLPSPPSNEQVTNEDLLTNCTLLLCHGELSPMNLLSLHTASGSRLFSVLSLGWGFVADVDVESEKYRCLGKIRFTLGTFLRLAALRTYHGTLSYLPVGAPSKISAGPPVGYDQPGPVDSLLVPLEQPVPENWTVVPDHEFVLVLALLHSHLGSEMYAAPMARGTGGVIHLFYIRAGVPRSTLLRLFMAMEKGTHMDLNCPNLVYVPVVAFRLEPRDTRGMITVDGEQLATEAVQGQVHPGSFQLVGGCPELKPGPEPSPLPCSEDSASSEFTS